MHWFDTWIVSQPYRHFLIRYQSEGNDLILCVIQRQVKQKHSSFYHKFIKATGQPRYLAAYFKELDYVCMCNLNGQHRLLRFPMLDIRHYVNYFSEVYCGVWMLWFLVLWGTQTGMFNGMFTQNWISIFSPSSASKPLCVFVFSTQKKIFEENLYLSTSAVGNTNTLRLSVTSREAASGYKR